MAKGTIRDLLHTGPGGNVRGSTRTVASAASAAARVIDADSPWAAAEGLCDLLHIVEDYLRLAGCKDCDCNARRWIDLADALSEAHYRVASIGASIGQNPQEATR